VIGFASAANYTNHAPMLTRLTAEFGFTLAAAGLLSTGIFLTHAGIQIPGGYMIDRFGSRPVLTVALTVICIGNIALGLANSYVQLLLWKGFVGLGTGTCFVAGARYVATTFAGSRRHAAQGLFGGSVVLGSGFVIFVVPVLLVAFDWRGTFFSTAALAGVAAAVWTLFAPESPADSDWPVPIAKMLANHQLWLLGITMVLTATPLVGQLVMWSKTFQSSFLALSVFALLALICSTGIHQQESPAAG
jgi:MFS family permease